MAISLGGSVMNVEKDWMGASVIEVLEICVVLVFQEDLTKMVHRSF